MSEFLPLDTRTGKVRGTSSNTGTELKPFDFSEVHVIGIGGSPPGGTTGQVLAKDSDTDFDTVWSDVSDLIAAVNGVQPLVSGQNYIDVTFATAQPSADWILTECHVVNTVDATPLNLAPGILTSKTTAGFRLQLNGAPNSANYELHWALGTVASGGGGGGGGGGTGAGVYNVLDYGAKADCVTLFDITMPNGNVVTSAAHTFVEADIGKWAVIRGATDSVGGESPLMGRITAVSGHTATLDVATNTALTNLYATDSFPRMDFGTDNTIPFILACMAVPGPGNRFGFGTGPPFAGGGVMNPILPGDGGTVYIPRGNYLLATVYPGRTDGTSFWWIETNNLILKGDGIGQTVIFRCSRTSGSMPLFGGFTGSHGLFQNWLVCDMTFYDLNYFTGVGNSLDIRSVDNCHIERIEICNSRGNGGINYQGYPGLSNRLWIKDCWVHGITEDGHSPSLFHSIEGDAMNVGEVYDVHIEGNRIEAPGRHGYEGGGNCAEQYFIGNTVDMRNPDTGISGGISGLNPTGGSTMVVMGNTIKGVAAGGYAIDCTVDVGPAYVANDIRIIGNYVHGNMQAGFRFQNTSNDNTIQHVNRIILANNWVQPDTNVSTAGILIGGNSGFGIALQMLITGNWFNNLGYGLSSVDGLRSDAGQWVVMRGNVLAASAGQPIDSACLGGNIICEDNVMPAAASTGYGGKGMSCNIDGNNVLAGANYSNTAVGLGYRTTDTVEILRGATTAGGLIIWAQVTAVDTVTTYVYNPTGGTLNTGTTTKYIIHRLLP